VKESGGAETLLRSADCTLWILQAAGNEWPGERRHTVWTDKEKGEAERERKRERVEERKRHTTFKQKQKAHVT